MIKKSDKRTNMMPSKLKIQVGRILLHPHILGADTAISGWFVPLQGILKSCTSDGATRRHDNSWIGNHPANQASPCVCFWRDAGAADTNRSLPDLISVIDRNNGRSQTMKQTYYVCPCRITLVWMALTEPPTKSLFCGLCQRVAMPGVAGTLSNHVGTFSIKDWHGLLNGDDTNSGPVLFITRTSCCTGLSALKRGNLEVNFI